ncbi:hypothetical protein [Virgibacillus halodenitrificans]|uniref:hypothetical protein n=1 Tax=Virgibacillus halodenitrificans TaxID=1482 RepID=UPI000EF5040B|nr:hypothetical protein [Virgibacillus halodenitrificans]
MDEELNKISGVLSELRNSSKLNGANSQKLYGILFLGSKFNVITSIELQVLLKRQFNINISNESLNNLIPLACQSLNMSFEGLKEINNHNTTKPDSYMITLW